MATYLLTWNPKNFPWDDLHDEIEKLEKTGHLSGDWSVGVTTKIKRKDRLFLMRLGKEPRGIVASGRAKSGVVRKPHWDPDAEADGKTSLYVNLDFDVILDPEKRIFPLARLQEGIYARMRWTPQGSGITIPDDIAAQLEKDWLAFVDGVHGHQEDDPDEGEAPETYIEGASKQVVMSVHERNPAAREACIREYGATCAACTMNFEEVYGQIGRGFIHVHHLAALADADGAAEIDPVADMRPVCPNCHAMLHQKKPAYTIEELRRFLNL